MNTGHGFTLPQIALLLANLIPVFGVLYLDWDVGSIIVLYWAENLVIGFYTILKILVTGSDVQEKPVICYRPETLRIEKRIVRPGKSIKSKHGSHCRES